MPAERIERVPTNLITGFLGVGKSTAIRNLLARSPADERWAVLVNEFGEVAIDNAALAGGRDDAAIRELPGGCMCCTLGAPFKVTLTRLLREARPDRLLIEPTGLGHPARVLDSLRSGDLAAALDVRATVCLVDPRQLADERITSREVFQDQVELAEVLVANKIDVCDRWQLDQFRQWSAGLFPPKARIEEVEQGDIDPAVLDIAADPERTPLFPHAHDHAHAHEHAEPLAAPRPGEPVRRANTSADADACGWIFHPDDRFDEQALLALLRELPVDRLKGVFRCGRWIHVDRVGDDLTIRTSAWRADSRVECIAGHGVAPAWPALEQRLRACLLA